MNKSRSTYVRTHSKRENDPVTMDERMTFAAKLYGKMNVLEPRGDAVCESCLALLKARLLTNKNGKRQVTIEVLPKEVKILDRKSLEPIFIYSMKDITYVWNDLSNMDTCGLIVKQPHTGEAGYEFFGYKLRCGSMKLIGALKRMFIEHYSTPIKLTEWSEYNALSAPEQKVGNLIDLDEPCTPVQALRLSAPTKYTTTQKGTKNWTRFDECGEEDEHNSKPIVFEDPWVTFNTQISTTSVESELGAAYRRSSFTSSPTTLQPQSQTVSNGNSLIGVFPIDEHEAFNPPKSQSTTTGNRLIPSWLEFENPTINWNVNPLVSGFQKSGGIL